MKLSKPITIWVGSLALCRKHKLRLTGVFGISKDRIVVLSANNEEQPVEQTASVMTLDENASAFAAEGMRYYSYSCGGNVDIGNYNDRDTYELVQTFGFTNEVAMLIRMTIPQPPILLICK